MSFIFLTAAKIVAVFSFFLVKIVVFGVYLNYSKRTSSMDKRFSKTTGICNKLTCKMKKHCIHFLALLENRSGECIEECDKTLLNIPAPQYETDCLFSSKEGHCYKLHRSICQMECNNCEKYIKRTYDKQDN